MIKRVVFFSLGIIISLALYSCVDANGKEPAKAMKAINTDSQLDVDIVPFIAEGSGPVEMTWKTLTDVQFKDIYVPELDAYYWKPTFGASVKALAGKEVYITGYVIPVDPVADFYVVSRFPFANCFFCGGGGPESVVDLRFPGKHASYKTDDFLTFKGILKLNADDVYSMNYIMMNAAQYTPQK